MGLIQNHRSPGFRRDCGVLEIGIAVIITPLQSRAERFRSGTRRAEPPLTACIIGRKGLPCLP
jgi:hypothetical protein